MLIKNKISPSPTVAINSLALKKKVAGERVYNLSAGEPMLPSHQIIVEAAQQAILQGKTRYTPALGIPELRQVAADWLHKNYQTNYSKENILVTAGGKFGLYALCRTLLGAGDEAIVIAPYWVSYPSLIEMTGAVVNTIVTQEKNNWKVNADQLRSAITPQTKIIFFNNASNPTGVLYSRAEIKSLLAVAHEKNILFVSDEVYSGLTYKGEFVSAGSFPEFSENVIVIQSCSKHFAMTGWRVGFVCGDEELIKVLGDLQTQSTTGAATVSQWAAVAAFQNAEQIISSVRDAMKIRRDTLLQTLEQTFGKKFTAPTAGLYAFINLLDIGVTEKNSLVWCKKILQEASVALVPGSAFGIEGHVRLSFGDEITELTAAVEALGVYLKKG